MKDKRSLHLKLQEFCDCFATTDFLGEMGAVSAGSEKDPEEGALKYLALAVLHGINDNAKKMTISKGKDGAVKVMVKYRTSEVPSPTLEIGSKLFEVAREITHIEGGKGKTPLALGVRDSSIELKVKMAKEDDCEIMKIKFPDLA